MGLYSEAAQRAYDTIKRKGGPVKIVGATLDDVPTNPNLPWEGSTTPRPDGFDHYAVFLPLASSLANRDANPFAESAIIAAFGLPFPIESGVNIQKLDGTFVSVVNVIALGPAGDEVIIYTCEVNTWPGI